MNLSAVLSLLIVCPPSQAASQGRSPVDSARIVILSDSVGPVITPDERQRYHLFSQIDGFDSAAVLQLPDSSFAVLFMLTGPGGIPRDTLIPYSITTILMLSEKIDHLEEIQRGSYALGRAPKSLRLAPGFVPVARGSLPRPSSAPLRPLLTVRSGDTPGPGGPLPQDRSHDTVAAIQYRTLPRTPFGVDPLPLAVGPAPRMPRFYPMFAVGFGIRTFAPDLSGLSPVTGITPPIVFSPMLDVTPEILVSDEIGIRGEGGFTPGDEHCYVAAISLVIYAHPFDNPWIRPFFEAGYVRTSFGGAFSGFQFHAGGGGARIGAGSEVPLGSLGISLDVCYDSIAKKTGSITNWFGADPLTIPATVDPSSIQFGLTLKIQ